MPQIKFRGVQTEKVQPLVQEMLDQLQQIIDCPREDLTLECLPSTFLNPVDGYPFVEVAWFDRGQATQDRVAQAITTLLQRAGYASVDVMFSPLEKNQYYENGQHF